MTEQTEAQRLADELIALHGYPLSIKAAAELRRLDAELERNKLAAWMIAQGYATGHGDTTEDLLKELEWQVREACAVLCDQLSDSSRDLRFGAAIRART